MVYFDIYIDILWMVLELLYNLVLGGLLCRLNLGLRLSFFDSLCLSLLCFLLGDFELLVDGFGRLLNLQIRRDLWL